MPVATARAYVCVLLPFWLEPQKLESTELSQLLHPTPQVLCTCFLHPHSQVGQLRPHFNTLPIPFTGIDLEMSTVANEIYMQYDFIPDSQLSVFAEAGYSVGSILEWLCVPTGVGNALLGQIGVHAVAHVSEVSYITLGEWEKVLAADSI